MHASTPWRAAGREPVTVWCRQPVSPNLSTDGIDVLWDFSRSEEGRDLMEGSTGHFVMREIVQDYLSYVTWAEDDLRASLMSRTACPPRS